MLFRLAIQSAFARLLLDFPALRLVAVLLDDSWEGEFEELVVVEGRRAVLPSGGDGLPTIWRTFCTICSNSSHLKDLNNYERIVARHSLFRLSAKMLPEAAAAVPILLQEFVQQFSNSPNPAFSAA